LAALLHRTLAVGVSHTAALNRGRHLYIRQGGHHVGHWPTFLVSSSFFPHLISSVADWMTTILPHMVWLSANLECRCEMYCTRLTENTGRKNDAKNRHLGTIAKICQAIFSQLRHVSTFGKNLLSSNISTCPHNMVNFGPLAPEIGSLVWGTPANFNGFRVLAALLHSSQVVSVSQTLQR